MPTPNGGDLVGPGQPSYDLPEVDETTTDNLRKLLKQQERRIMKGVEEEVLLGDQSPEGLPHDSTTDLLETFDQEKSPGLSGIEQDDDDDDGGVDQPEHDQQIGWVEARELIEKGEVRWDFRESTVPGTWVIEATVSNFALPVGQVWFRYVGNHMVDILHSYVLPECRRVGLRTYLHRRILESHEDHWIMTSQGNSKSLPWLEKMGFSQNERNEWVLPPNVRG